MHAPTLRDLIGDQEVAAGVEEICHELESRGWFPRARRGSYGVAYWPEQQRSRQYIIDVRYPMNEHRRDVLMEHTGLKITVENLEGGQQ